MPRVERTVSMLGSVALTVVQYVYTHTVHDCVSVRDENVENS